jgi:secreted Zn-dependent insulinase-like peptidase
LRSFIRYPLGIALLALGLAGCQLAPPDEAAGAPPVVVAKSPNDDREYRYLELDNQLKVLLVSDQATDKAAASLVAFRGQYDDPIEYGGLAHFLEHMLFIGTEKYPEIDGYQTFISAHGGSSNAYTAADHTNYFFDIQPEYFQAGMDRFAQFFIAPLFDTEYVEREKHAVHSETQLQIKDDRWRAMSAQRMVFNPDHPASRFHIGTLETLGEGVGDALVEFFEHNYSSDQMALVAFSNESLDALEAWIVPMFEELPNRELGTPPATPALFRPGDLPATLFHKPIKESRSVSYTFPLPPVTEHYASKPEVYLSNLLGHEGEHSLHHELKTKGWIESLGVSAARFVDDTAILEISIALTETGLAHIEAITSALFAYIDLLKANPPEAWRYAEQAKVADLSFRFQEQSSATAFVYQVCPNLRLYPPQDILRAPRMMDRFDPELIERFLAYLTEDNVLLEVIAPDVQTDQVERFFDVPYTIHRGPLDFAQSTDHGLKLPQPNAFLPDILELMPEDSEPPRQAGNLESGEIWVDTDTEFGTPRANLFLTLTVQGGLQSVGDIAAARLYRRLVQDELNVFTYPAYLAGLNYSLSVVPAGFRVSLNGYSDKQAVLLDAVLEAFKHTEIDAERFDRYRKELTRNWRNFKNERPYSQTYASLNQLLVSNSWPPEQLADALDAMTFEDLERWRQSRLQEHGLLALLHGNVDAADASRVTATVAKHLRLGDIPPRKPDIAQIDGNYRVAVDVDHNDASMVLFVQDPVAGLRARAKSALAAQLLRQSYFTELRTEQQLGYVVSLANTTFRDQAGIAFIIQSPVASPKTLEAATQAFLDAQVSVTANLSDEAFETQRSSLIARLTERDKNLGQRTRRFWVDLDLGITDFDSREQMAEHVRSISQEEMTAFVETLRTRARDQRLIIYNTGHFTDAPENGELITDLARFKTL